MTKLAISPTALQIKRTFAAPRGRVFAAFTEVAALRQWFAVAEGFTTPVAEVDLKVGGRYRLGMQAPDSEQLLIVGGFYQEIVPPERLVFTWRWEMASPDDPETIVTVEFHERGGSTEVVLTHERFTETAIRDEHGQGWEGCFAQLAPFLTGEEV